MYHVSFCVHLCTFMYFKCPVLSIYIYTQLSLLSLLALLVRRENISIEIQVFSGRTVFSPVFTCLEAVLKLFGSGFKAFLKLCLELNYTVSREFYLNHSSKTSFDAVTQYYYFKVVTQKRLAVVNIYLKDYHNVSELYLQVETYNPISKNHFEWKM